MDQKFCTTIVSADPRKSLRPRESHPGVIPDYPVSSRIKTFDRTHRSYTACMAGSIISKETAPFETAFSSSSSFDVLNTSW